MRTADGAYIKQLNRSLILEEIIKNGKISRADLSKRTGLNKATVSVQVADLLADELIYESREEHNTIGRRPIMLSIDSSCGYILGIDIDLPAIQFAVADLSGNIVEDWTIPNETKDYPVILEQLIGQIIACKKRYSECTYGLISVNISVHGTVNIDESIDFIPRLEWRNKDLKSDLVEQLDMDITISNNANLSAFAEHVYDHQTEDLLSLILTSGIGIGVMINGELHKGHSGHAGEVGHMILHPEGRQCPCGNQGCLELYASESALLSELANELGKPDLNQSDIKELIAEQRADVLERMEVFLDNIAIGLNNVMQLYNPKTIVLNSEILTYYPNAIPKIESRLTSTSIQYGDIVLSSLGNRSAVMGACAIGLQRFFKVSELHLHLSQQNQEVEKEQSIIT